MKPVQSKAQDREETAGGPGVSGRTQSLGKDTSTPCSEIRQMTGFKPDSNIYISEGHTMLASLSEPRFPQLSRRTSQLLLEGVAGHSAPRCYIWLHPFTLQSPRMNPIREKYNQIPTTLSDFPPRKCGFPRLF